MSSLRTLALAVEPLTPRATGDIAYQRFEVAPDCPSLPVVDGDDRPVGLIERNAFFIKLASQYGRAVFGPRPVTLLMDAQPLVMEADTPAGDFAAMALRDFSGQLQQGFIVVDKGRYLGVGSILDLLKAAVAERTGSAEKLRALAERLRLSNLEMIRSRRFADTVIEHIPLLVAVCSERDGKIVMINRTGARMLDTSQEALVGRAPGEVRPLRLSRQLREAEAVLAALPPATARDMRFLRCPGEAPRTLRALRLPIRAFSGKSGTGFPPENAATHNAQDSEPLTLIIAEDVTEVRQAVSRIAELAHFDTLTGLPNRAQWQERLSQILEKEPGERSGEESRQAALLAIDLDRFKTINDSFGHDAGDEVLRQVASRLRDVVRPADLPARLGGDEFAVIVTGPDIAVAAERIAERLIDRMKQPFHLGGKIVHLGASVGIAIWPDDGTHVGDLMKHADMALYQAKADGKGIWRRFCATMRAGLEHRSLLAQDLRRALELGQIEAHLQPQFNLALQRITGFECLMRWNHPDHGQVPPATFIPLAEEIGLINPLGEWMIRRACEIAGTLPEDITIAVNISALQFRLPGLVACVTQAVARAGIAARRLELEITESVLIADETQVLHSIGQLRELGVRIALDDFGTGFASFAYLQRFPFDRIKIDRSFVSALPMDRSSRAIVSAVTVLAGQLGAVTTGEGVETEAQMQALRQLGCTEVQGFLIGRPSPDPRVWFDAAQGSAHDLPAAATG